MSIIITIISNITVLVSHNVICLGYLMPMNHGVKNKARLIFSPPPLPLTRFSPGLFIVLQEILYQLSFALTRLLQKITHFQCKTIFFFQLIAGLDFAVLHVFLSQFCHHETTNSFFIIVFMHRKLQAVFVSQETKLEVATTSIILSCLCHFGSVNKELFRYC